MDNSLFKNVFAVDIDLSYTGIIYATYEWYKYKHGTPNIIYYNGYDPEYIKKVDFYLKNQNKNYTFIEDHRYQKGSWSVGTVTECGYGSVGS